MKIKTCCLSKINLMKKEKNNCNKYYNIFIFFGDIATQIYINSKSNAKY